MSGSNARRRASRRRFMMRRLVAFVIVVAIAGLAVKAVGSVLSDDEPVAGAGEPTDSVDPAATDSADPSAVATGATVAPATVPPSTAPADTGPPTGENKATVYVVGDSDAGTFGPYLETLLDGTNIV